MTPNVAAFLAMIAHSEGCDRPPAPADPYRTCFAYRHVIVDLSYHPHEMRADGTREWAGSTLTDEQCINAGFHPGCISSAAGRYQITLPTFQRLRGILRTTGFWAEVQDDMAVQLIKESDALDLVMSGQVGAAIAKCSHLWASLPGSTSGQPQKKMADLINIYGDSGGAFA